MTIEEAQERIIELTDALTEMTAQRDSLSQENETLTTERDSLRDLNQKYFNRLIAQDKHEDKKEDDEPEPPTCEEFAATLKI